MAILLFLLLIILLAAAAFYVAYPAWSLRRLPSAPSLFGIGHLPLLLKHQHRIFSKLAAELGCIFRLQVGRQPIVVLTNPDHIREVGIKKFKSVCIRGLPPYVKTCPALLQGITFSVDSKWTPMRSLMTTMFHWEQLSNYVPIMHRCTDNLANVLHRKSESKEDVNVTELFHKFTLDVLGETVFGTKFGLLQKELGSDPKDGSDDGDIASALIRSIDGLTLNQGVSLSVVIGMLFPILQESAMSILKRIPGTRDRRHYKDYARLVKKATELLRARSGQSEGRKDVVSLLLNARFRSKELHQLLSEERMIALTYEVMLAGSSSTAITMGSVLYCVSSHPFVEQKLLQEIDLLAPPGTVPTMREVDSFTYLDLVLKESMRVMFASPIVAREAVEDVEVGEHRFAKGTTFWLALIVPTEDPKVFTDPLCFRPERFEQQENDGEQQESKAANCVWPFGLGPKMCLGFKFSTLEIKLALIRMYQHFVFRHSPLMESPLEVQFGAMVSPVHGVKLRVHPRRCC